MQYSPFSHYVGPQIRDRGTQTVRYDCTKCDSRFSSKAYLHHHEVAHQTMFYCPFRCALFSNKADFQRHVKSHTEKKILPCSQCSRTFTDIRKYISHVKEHTEKPMTACHFCSAKFVHVSELRKHMSSHYKKKYFHIYTKNSETENAPVIPSECFYKTHAPLDNDIEVVPNGISNAQTNEEERDSDFEVTETLPAEVSSQHEIKERKKQGAENRQKNKSEETSICLLAVAKSRPRILQKITRKRNVKTIASSARLTSTKNNGRKKNNLAYAKKNSKFESNQSNRPTTSRSISNALPSGGNDVKNVGTIASGSEATLTKNNKRKRNKNVLRFSAEECKSSKSITVGTEVKSVSQSNRMKLRSNIGSSNSSEVIQFSASSADVKNVDNKASSINRRFSTRKTAGYNHNLKKYEMRRSRMNKNKKEAAGNITSKFLCVICKMAFISYENLTKHEFIHNRKIGSYQCERCQAKFLAYSGLMSHTRSCKAEK